MARKSRTAAKPVQERVNRRHLLRSTALQAVVGLAFAIPGALPVRPAAAQPAPNARPQGGQVVAGSAAISHAPTSTTINQSSNRAAIDWRSFDVGRNQSVTFQQPSSASVTLNRVTGPDPSAIAGRISANGQFVLVNPSGVVFHQGSQVNAQSVVVSAAGISNQNFMAGRMVFDQAARPDARIENRGAITVKEAGLAALVAPSVANSGVITARMGHVVLAGAAAHTIDMYGDGLISIDVTRQVRQAPVGPDGKVVTALVTNTGTIAADGGTIVLTARAADGVVQNLVRAGGSVHADTAGGQTGRIEITGTGGSVVIEGHVAAAGRVAGTMGGTVVVAGSRATVVAPTARISASGQAGGGTVALGTTLARATGSGPAPTGTSARTLVATGARVSADATRAGHGGRVTVLSTQSTSVGGTVSARGGRASGNGGTVELSGEAGFRLTGRADTSAPHGALGTIVLDPRDLTITATAAGSNRTRVSTVDPNIAADAGGTATDAYVTPAQVQQLTGNVRLQATRDLTVASDLTYGGGSSLTLEAGRNLTVNAGVTLKVPVFQSQSGFIPSVLTLTAAAAGISGRDPAGTLQVLGNLSASGFALAAGSGGIVLGGQLTTLPGTVNSIAFATTGSVTQTGGSLATGNLTGNAGSLSLTQAANQVGGIGVAGAQFITTLGGATVTTAVPLSIGSTGAIPGGLAVPAGQTISIQADTLTLASSGGPVLSAPGGTVALAPLTANQGILVSGIANASSGTTTYAVAQLGLVQASTLQLGAGAASTGSITFGLSASDPVDLIANGNFARLALATGGAVRQNGALSVNALSGRAGDVILNTITNRIAAIEGLVADGQLQVVTSGDLTVSGATSGNNGLDLTAGGAFNLTGTGSILGPNGISLSAGFALIQAGMTLAGTVSSNQSVSLSAGTGGIALSGAIQPGQSLSISTTGALTQTSGAVTGGTLYGTAASVSLPSRGNAINALGVFAPLDVTSGDLLVVNSTPLAIQNNRDGGPGGLILSAGRKATVVTDLLSLDTTNTPPVVSIPGGTFVLAPFTTGGSVLLTSGTKPTTGLSLTTAELAQINASTLQVGGTPGSTPGSTNVPAAGTVTVGRTGESAVDLGVSGITTLAVYGSGAMTQGAALGVATVTGQAASLDLSNGGNFIQALQGFTVTAGGIALRTSSGLTVSGAVATSGSNVSLSSRGAVAGRSDGTSMLLTGDISGSTVTLNSLTGAAPAYYDSGITQAGGTVTAGTLTGAGGFLNLARSNQIATLGDFATYRALTVSSSRALAVTGAVSSANGAVTLNTRGLTQTASSSISTAELDGSSTGDTVLNSRNNAVAGMGTFSQQAGDFTLVTSSPRLLFGSNTGTLTAATGSFTFVADRVGLVGEPSGNTAIMASSGAVTFAPFNASRRMELIGATAADPASLSVSQSLLSRITAIRLGLGAADSTGPVNIANANEAVDLTGHAGTLQLRTTGTVTEGVSPGGQDGGGTLGLAVANLTGSTGSLALNAPANAIRTIGVSDGIAGGLDGLAAAGSLGVQSALSLTVANTVSAGSPSGMLSIGSAGALRSTGALSGGSVTLGASGGTLSQTAGTITAAETLTLLAPGQAVSQTGGTITVGTLAGGAASMALGGADNRVGTLGGVTVSGAFTLTDGQSLSVTGPFRAGDANLAVTGNLLLAGAVTVPGTLALSATGAITQPAGAVTAGTLTGSAVSASLVAAGNSIDVLGGFTTTGALAVTDARALRVSGPVSAASMALTVGGDLTLAAAVSTPGTLDLEVSGAVTQGTAPVTATTLLGRAASLSLDMAGNSVGTLGAFTTTGAFALADSRPLSVSGPLSAAAASLGVAGDLTLAGTVSIPGTLSLSATGAITQPGGTVAAGTLTGNAASASLGQANAVGTLGAFATTGGFALTDGQALTVSGPVSASSASLVVAGDLALTGTITTPGTLTLSSTGAITQPSGTVTAGTLTGSAAAATLGRGNAVATLGQFTTTGGFTLTDGQSLAVSGPVSASSASLAVTGDLALTSTITTPGTLTLSSTGAITQPSGTVTAGTLMGSAASVALSQNNAVTTLGTFATTGSFALANGQALTVAGPLLAGTANLSTAGNLTLAGTVTTPGTLTLAAGGAITQSGGSITAGVLAGNGASAALGSTGNSVATLGGFSTTGAFALTDARPLTVSGPVSASSASLVVAGDLVLSGAVSVPGTLALSATGAITQPGGTVTAGTLTSSAASASLGQANRVGTLGAVTTTGAFALTDARPLAVSGPVSAASASLAVTGDLALTGTVVTPGTLTLFATGAIAQGGGSIAAGTLAGNGASAALGSSGNSVATLAGFSTTGAFALTDARPLTVSGPLSTASASLAVTGGLTLAGNVVATETLMLSATDAIIQPGGTIAAGTLTGSAASATLGQANAIAGLGSFTTTGAVALTDARALSVSGPVSAASANLTVAGDLALAGTITVPGLLSLSATGAVTQTGGTLLVGTLTGSAAGASFGQAGNQVSVLSGFSSSGDFMLADAAALTVAGPVSAGQGGTLAIRNDALGFARGGSLSAPGGTVALAEYTAGQGITLAGDGGLGSDPPVAANTLMVGSVTGGPVVIAGAFNLSTVPVLDLRSSGAITETGAGALRVGTLMGQGASATLGGANQIGTLGPFTAPGGLVLTDTQALSVSGPVSAASVNLTVAGDLALAGTITTPGTLSLAATGAIAQPGGSIAAGALGGNGASAAIDRTDNSIATLAGFTTMGDFALTDGRSLVVTGPVDLNVTRLNVIRPNVVRLTVRGDLVLNSGVTGGTVMLDVTGAITQGLGGRIAASTLTGNGASAALTGDNRVGTLGAFTTVAGLVFNNGQALSVAGPVGDRQSVEIAAAGPLSLSGTVAAPSINLRGTGGITLAAASAVTADALTLAANGPVSIAGSIQAGTLAVATSGALAQTGGNLVVGTLTGTAGSIDLGQAGGARIDGIANLTAGSTAVVVDQGPLRVSGTVASPALALTATGTLTLDGGAIRIDGTPAVPGSALTVRPGNDGTSALRQLGTTAIVPISGRLATLRLDLPASGGTLALNNLQAPSADLVLGLGLGTARGNLVVNNLTLVGAGGRATLTGTVLGRTGTTAAQFARVNPRVDLGYTLNGCVVAAVSCAVNIVSGTVFQPIAAIASLLRLDLLTFDVLDLSVRRDRDDPNLLLPNISDRDY